MKLTPEQKAISDLEINIDNSKNCDLKRDLEELLCLLQNAEIKEAFKLNEDISARIIAGNYEGDSTDLKMHEDIWYLTLNLYRDLKTKFKLPPYGTINT